MFYIMYVLRKLNLLLHMYSFLLRTFSGKIRCNYFRQLLQD